MDSKHWAHDEMKVVVLVVVAAAAADVDDEQKQSFANELDD